VQGSEMGKRDLGQSTCVVIRWWETGDGGIPRWPLSERC
jgi:hypothetical protein